MLQNKIYIEDAVKINQVYCRNRRIEEKLKRINNADIDLILF